MSRFSFSLAALAIAWVLSGCEQAGGGSSGGGFEDPPLSDAASDSARKMSIVLAWVGDVPVTGGDVLRHMEMSSTPENAKKYLSNPGIVQVALNGYLDQLVWGEVARREGFELTPSERRQVLALEGQLLASRYLVEVVEKKAAPTREEVEASYKEHAASFMQPVRVGVRHILVGTESEARRLADLARQGQDFAALVQQHSKDETTRELGGALGYIQEGSEILGIGESSAFESAVLPLKPGEVTVIDSQLGWHVVKVERREGGTIAPLEEVYDSISKSLVNKKFREVYNEELLAGRTAVEARYEEANFEKFTGTSQACDMIFATAKEHPDPEGQVELYRRIVFDFPKCKLAAEAQFRIGYLQWSQLNNQGAARKAFLRLQKIYPDSPWRKAGDFLLQNLGEDPETMPTVEDVLRASGGGAE